MPVGVKCKAGGMVSEVFLQGLHVVPVLERQYRVGMAQIVNLGIRCTDLDGDFLEVIVAQNSQKSKILLHFIKVGYVCTEFQTNK